MKVKILWGHERSEATGFLEEKPLVNLQWVDKGRQEMKVNLMILRMCYEAYSSCVDL